MTLDRGQDAWQESRLWQPLGLLLVAAVFLVSAAPSAGQPREPSVGPFRISATPVRRVMVTAKRHEYRIHLGGTVDMDNTSTRHYNRFDVAFQPNLAVEIANVGDVPLINPRVVTNNKRKWWSLDELLDEILAGADDDEEKALLIWDFVRRHRHHDSPLFPSDELHDPVKYLCCYGGGLCDDSGNVGCSLLYHAGLNQQKYQANPKTRSMHGHVMCEARLADGYQFLDIDQDAFYLDRENEQLVSGDAVARDHDLAKREHAYGPIFQGWDVGAKAACVLGADDGASFRAVAGHRIDMTLRPGEAITYRWDNRGKFATSGPARRSFWANSLLRYEPRLDIEHYQEGVSSANDIIAAAPGVNEAKLAGRSRDAYLDYKITSPFVMCGGRLAAGFVGLHEDDQLKVSLSLDEKNWQQIWQHAGQGDCQCVIDLDEHLHTNQAPAKYHYFIRVSLGSAAAGTAQLADLRIETDVMTSPHFLPRLSLGQNNVVYTDETAGERRVSIMHYWRESENIRAPAPPDQPVFPPDESVVRQSTFDFRWPAVNGAHRYHIQVSRSPEMRLPYRTSFDVVVDQPKHGSPFSGMFSPDADYYWRVRSQNRHGVWSPWSDVWQFRWDGPRVPVDVDYRTGPQGEITISWKPNPRGPRPVAYEVYGSNERGFSISKQPYNVLDLGRQPANFLGETSDTSMTVVSASATHPNQNRCFYRVVAVDEKGTASGPSDYIELPHPYLYSRPPSIAYVGKPFRYQLKTLRSIGDLQYRYTSPGRKYWEREEYEYELIEGPIWLDLDARSGLLSGEPADKDLGTVEVVVAAKRRFPYEVQPSEEKAAVFQKSGEQFQASHEHRFTIQVCQ